MKRNWGGGVFYFFNIIIIIIINVSDKDENLVCFRKRKSPSFFAVPSEPLTKGRETCGKSM